MFRRFRILVLLLLLVFVGLTTLLDNFYAKRWNAPLVVAVYPINGDGSSLSRDYIANLADDDFAQLVEFFSREAREYKIALERPIRVTLAPTLQALPPKPPQQSPNALKVMLWSLSFRWWAWRTPPDPPGPMPRIRLFLLYHDPAKHPTLDHSTGLAKGKLGIVNLFAARNAEGPNQVVVAHELLHTLGATDKYDLRSTQPLYPEGYAEPNAAQRYPQRFAELMAGRIPISSSAAEIPDSLAKVLIGSTTAQEIGWAKR